MSKMFIGVDPGASGCIVHFDENNQPQKSFIPKIGNGVDVHALSKIFLKLSENDCHVVLEDVHAIFGSAASATFSFGWINGIIEGILVAYEIPYTKVQPKKWQAEMFEGIKEIRKAPKPNKNGVIGKGKLDTKAMSIMSCKRLFPNFSLTISDRGKKDMDGCSDAALMAEFCRRNFK